MSKNNIASEEYPRRPRRREEEPPIQPPLTPMIDVTFQLLLYFLLTADFRDKEGQIPGTLPNLAGAQSATKPKKIEIVLAPIGEFYEKCSYEVDKRAPVTTPSELQAILGELKGSMGEDTAVVIRSAGMVRWKFIVETFNSAVVHHFTKIGFGSSD